MALTPVNRQEEWYQQIINASTGKYLPSVTVQDAGKVLTVGDDGSWEADAIPKELPTVETTDKDKYLHTNASTGALEWVASDKQISATYSEIKSLRDSGNLVKGATYRMTDFVTKINGTYDLSTIGASGYLHIAKSAEHPFDLLLYAIDESHLSEIAKATWHEDDSYFADANVSAWDIRYCIDNDSTRFAWADTEDGKGVIYWMRDEWGNEAWMDFKNVLNVRYALSASDPNLDTGLAYDASEQPNRYGSPQHQFQALQGYMESGSYNSPFHSPYDFAVGANILGTVQMASLDDTYLSTFNADLYYTFDYFDGAKHIDASLNANAKVPVMENVFDYESDSVVSLLTGSMNPMGLNGSVFETNSVYVSTLGGTGSARCVGNKIGTNSWYNTFGNACQTNELKDLCYNNIFGNSCYSNTFGNDCNSNTFWNNCGSNTFVDTCYSNTFGNICGYNTFEYACDNNTFGNNCNNNTFGNSCYSNTFGNNCNDNTFGNNCNDNTFGNFDNNNELQGYIKFSKMGDNCQYVIVAGGSESTPVMHYTITDAVKGQYGSPLTINTLTQLERETYVGYNSSGVLKTWCPADLVN